MITGYRQLTKKYLQNNKKRTILTLVGIILSVALISSIGLFLKGIQEVDIEQTKNTHGSYHLQYTNANKELVEKVSNNPKVSKSGTYIIEEEGMLNETITTYKIKATQDALELLPYQSKEGRLPQTQEEVALEQWLLRYIDPNASIGDELKVGSGTYTLVGVLENNVIEQINNRGVILTQGAFDNNQETTLLIEISPKTNLKSAVEELRDESNLGEEIKVEENTRLLFVLGATGEDSGYGGLYLVVGVIITIVMISTIAVIYNAFQISVVERMKEFGLLRAVGTTPKQIREIVLREATLLSLIGIPLGLFFGIVAIYSIGFVFQFIGGDNINVFKPVISPFVLGISGMIGLITIYLSALLPAIFAGKVSPLVAISSRNAIKKENIKERKNLFSEIIRKTLGFEGQLAYKNIKRNPKRYRITVFSVVISVMLFITFTSFMNMSLTVTERVGESQNVHFSVTRNTQGRDAGSVIEEEIIEDIMNIPWVEKVYGVYPNYQFSMEIDKGKEIKELQDFEQEFYRDSPSEGKIGIYGNINIYDRAALEVSQKYVTSGDINIETLNQENGAILIRKNHIYNFNTGNIYYGSIADIKVGDEIHVSERLPWQEDRQEIDTIDEKLKVVAIVEDEIFSYKGHQEGLKLITSQEVAAKLTKEETFSPINLNIVLKNAEMEQSAITEIENIINRDPNFQLINHIDNNRRQKSAALMMQILLYGFVVVVALIGSVNIINTLITNILLRKREFATLRSIGLTHRGLKKIIILEGMLYGVMGIVYGSILGSLFSFILAGGIGSVREFSWDIPWGSICIAAMATLIIGFLSVQYPLLKIKKENLIQTIREEQ